ncbi:MAG: hypothetical protein A2Y17_13295 [Clostridiales bacterium GWF2_38_85]|nr:MAG: hypothetical protein A2Y17_13295 [Clostridiales bacterium GWF2_38_85]
MDENKEKRMISNTDYEVKQSFRIGGKEILLAEDPNANENLFYMVCQYTENGIIGEYSQAIVSEDYLEVLLEFTKLIEKEATAIQEERDAIGQSTDLFSAAQCEPNDYTQSIEGKVIAIKSEVFSPEYRRGNYQLVLAISGNGAMANPRGNAVFCQHLNSGKHTRFERYEVLGVVRTEAMPDWAKVSLVQLQGKRDKPTEQKEYAGNYEIIERIEVGQKVYGLGFREGAVQPYGTWQGWKNSNRGFDAGHYFSDVETAKADLHDRAAKEQERIDRPKRREEGAR